MSVVLQNKLEEVLNKHIIHSPKCALSDFWSNVDSCDCGRKTILKMAVQEVSMMLKEEGLIPLEPLKIEATQENIRNTIYALILKHGPCNTIVLAEKFKQLMPNAAEQEFRRQIWKMMAEKKINMTSDRKLEAKK